MPARTLYDMRHVFKVAARREGALGCDFLGEPEVLFDCGDAFKVPLDIYIAAHKAPPKRIVLDLDATDDPLHGNQEGRFFHGYYRNYCYLPLYIFDGRHLLVAKLRRANIDASAGAKEEIARIVAHVRKAWPEVEVWLRAKLMAWCDENRVDYVFGLARNKRLEAMIADALAAAKAEFATTGKAARAFEEELTYRTLDSWSCERRVVAKAEHLQKGSNPRFIVTSLSADAIDGRELYEKVYCRRGEMENRIKECQLDLYADRTSAATMRANQLRLWFASLAYVLIEAVRRLALEGTHLAKATAGSIRSKLLKLGAIVTVSVRRIRIAIASACAPPRTCSRLRTHGAKRASSRLCRRRGLRPPANTPAEPQKDSTEPEAAATNTATVPHARRQPSSPPPASASFWTKLNSAVRYAG